MKNKFILITLLTLSACSVSQIDLRKAELYCSDKGGIFEIRFDAWEPVVVCKDNSTLHVTQIK